MVAVSSLIPELEEVLQNGDPHRHGEVLRQITTLFLQSAPRFNEDHVRLFDDVFGRLIEEIESKARAELSHRLAPVANAPLETVRRLAHDDDIAVAGPVLTQSPRLADHDLVDIARSKGQAHLIAISGREELKEVVTDVLVSRGDREVARKVAENPGARLSETGYSRLVRRAEHDGALAETVAQREDIPGHLFRELLTRATEVVQRRLLASARPETQAEIRRVLAKVSDEVGSAAPPERDFTRARENVQKAAGNGSLEERDLAQFATGGRYEETIVALSDLCSVPADVVEKLMGGERPDPVLILCKSAGFEWRTARAVILVRPSARFKTGLALEQASGNFDRLSLETAQRVVRFWQAGSGQVAVS